MHAVVLDVLAVEAALVPEVLLKLLVDVVGHRLPAETETRKRSHTQKLSHTAIKDHQEETNRMIFNQTEPFLSD